MRNVILFFLTKLTVLALVVVLTGCGGSEGGGSDQNQSSTQKPDNSEGGQAAKPMEKPAEKFTPEMVKISYLANSKMTNLSEGPTLTSSLVEPDSISCRNSSLAMTTKTFVWEVTIV